LRAIGASHYYIDGTFDTVPKGFLQKLVIMTNDPITNHPKPLAYILLTSKDEELYNMALRGFKEIITNHGTRKINLTSVTLDFEVALINSVRLNFPDIKIIGCLFHLKNALWRWARQNKLGNKDKIQKTTTLINKLVSLCWKPSEVSKTINGLKSSNKNDQEISNFLRYFEKTYTGHFVNGMLDYTDIQQHTRANSCLEGYHNHLQQVIPSQPSWFKLVEGLKEEEFNVFNEQLTKERNGDYFISSTSQQKCSDLSLASKAKGQRRSRSHNSQIKDVQVNKKSKSAAKLIHSSKKIIKDEGLKLKRKIKNNKGQKKVKQTSTNNYNSIKSFQNSCNSCRYDAFLSFYLYSIYYSFDLSFEFDDELIPEEIFDLYITCDNISEGKSLTESRDDFWILLHAKQFDEKPYGVQGFVTDLFRIFNKVTNFHLIYDEKRSCIKCKFFESIRVHHKTSLTSIPSQLRKQSFDESYMGLFETQYFVCPKCSAKSFRITKTIVKEPNYIVLIDDGFVHVPQNNYNFLALNPKFKNSKTGNNYIFISSINIPYSNHYNTILKDPFFQSGKQFKGYYLHDGLIDNGIIQPIEESQVNESKPYIAISKLL